MNRGTPPAYERLAPLYDRLIGCAFLPGLVKSFDCLVRCFGIRFRTAADVGCGTGLFARYLARRWGALVYGVDRSAAMLDVARRRGGAVRYLRQDMRRLELPEPVDLVTANFDTLNHLLRPADVQCTLRAISAALRPGGHLIFDALTRCMCQLTGLALGRDTADGRVVQVVESCDPDGAMVIALAHLRPGAPPLVVRNVERAYPPSLLRAWLRQSGLGVLGIHDAGTRPGPCPPRIVVVARKATG